MTARRAPRWEQKLLTALSYPANLALGGAAAFLLGLGVVTLLPALIALARALHSWRRDGDDAVFTNTFREFARTWRRSIGLGIVVGLSLMLLTVDALFLLAQLTTNSQSLAVAFAAAAIPVAAVLLLGLLAVPIAAARLPQARMREWLLVAGHLIAAQGLRSLFLLVLTLAFLATCLLLPTVLPFFGYSIPLYFALITWTTTLDDPDEP